MSRHWLIIGIVVASGLITPGLGWAAPWTKVTGFASGTVRSNQLEPSNAGAESMAIYTSVTWGNDQYAYLKVVSATAAARVFGVILRGTTSARTDYECQIHGPLGAATNLYIYRVNAGAATLLASTTAVVATTDVMKCEVIGSTIKQYINGVERLSVTDGSPIASGSAGIMTYSNGALSDTQVDDWGAGDSGGGDLATDNFNRANAPLDMGTCSGGTPTLYAASASRTDVNDCVETASTGDTIMVPDGASTWAAGISITTKDLILIGGGNGSDTSTNTVITMSNGACFSLADGGGASSSTRITMFRFVNCYIGLRGLNGNNAFRIDHNYFQDTTLQDWTIGGGDSIANAKNPKGLIDHNTFDLVRFVIFGTIYVAGDDSMQRQHKIWSQDPGFGDAQAIYIEDNIIHDNAPGTIDCNLGGALVYRFNTVTVTDTYVSEAHGVQGVNRGCQRWEFYGNTMTQLGGENFTFAFQRGGSGFYFDNTLSTNGFSAGPALKVERVTEDKPTFGFCDGVLTPSTIIDGLLGSGYPCRDSIGHPQDSSLYTGDYPFSGTTAWPSQDLYPVYTWNNLEGATQLAAYRFNGTATHNAEERDFYNFSSATGTPQTVGVRVGTLANRPAGCTAGVGYFATDQGSWNTSASNEFGNQRNGADGVLYKCTATDTWNVLYTPYIYPHPLNIDDATPPTNVSAITIARVLRFMEIASIIAGLGWHFRRPLLAGCLAALSLCGTLVQLAPKSYDTVKMVSKESAVKVLTVFNHITKPRI